MGSHPNPPMNHFSLVLCKRRGGDENPLLYLDAKEQLKPKERLGKSFHLSINYTMFLHKPDIDCFLDTLDDGKLMGHNEPFDTLAFAIQAKTTIPDAESLPTLPGMATIRGHPTDIGKHNPAPMLMPPLTTT